MFAPALRTHTYCACLRSAAAAWHKGGKQPGWHRAPEVSPRLKIDQARSALSLSLSLVAYRPRPPPAYE